MHLALVLATFAALCVLTTTCRAQSSPPLRFEAIWIGPTASFVITPYRSADLGGELSLFYGRPAESWSVGLTVGGSEERVYGGVLYSRFSHATAGIPFATVVALGPVYEFRRFHETGAQLSLSEMIIPLFPFTARVNVYPHERPVLAIGVSFMFPAGF